ncbi:hypothetical protein HDU97_004907 [Phlyctochytrium planicorne]|nr:hypothetical protein HDU97_004907 [Phlyctochytrium planicorne]
MMCEQTTTNAFVMKEESSSTLNFKPMNLSTAVPNSYCSNLTLPPEVHDVMTLPHLDEDRQDQLRGGGNVKEIQVAAPIPVIKVHRPKGLTEVANEAYERFMDSFTTDAIATIAKLDAKVEFYKQQHARTQQAFSLLQVECQYLANLLDIERQRNDELEKLRASPCPTSSTENDEEEQDKKRRRPEGSHLVERLKTQARKGQKKEDGAQQIPRNITGKSRRKDRRKEGGMEDELPSYGGAPSTSAIEISLPYRCTQQTEPNDRFKLLPFLKNQAQIVGSAAIVASYPIVASILIRAFYELMGYYSNPFDPSFMPAIFGSLMKEVGVVIFVKEKLGWGASFKVFPSGCVNVFGNVVAMAILTRLFNFEGRQTFVFSNLVANICGFFVWKYMVGHAVFNEDSPSATRADSFKKLVIKLGHLVLEAAASTIAFTITYYYIGIIMMMLVRLGHILAISVCFTPFSIFIELCYYEVLQRWFAKGLSHAAAEGSFNSGSIVFAIPIKLARLIQSIRTHPGIFWASLFISIFLNKIIPRLSAAFRMRTSMKKVAAIIQRKFTVASTVARIKNRSAISLGPRATSTIEASPELSCKPTLQKDVAAPGERTIQRKATLEPDPGERSVERQSTLGPDEKYGRTTSVAFSVRSESTALARTTSARRAAFNAILQGDDKDDDYKSKPPLLLVHEDEEKSAVFLPHNAIPNTVMDLEKAQRKIESDEGKNDGNTHGEYWEDTQFASGKCVSVYILDDQEEVHGDGNVKKQFQTKGKNYLGPKN